MKDSSKKKSRFHKAVSLILKIIACLIIAVIGGFIFMVVQLNKYSDDSRKAESLLLTEFENPVPCEISLTADDKEKDFIYLYRSLKKGCPGAYIEINGKSFLDRKEEYIELVRNTESDFEYYCVLSAILSNIPSCHTQLVTDTDSLKIYMDSLNSSEVILSENMSSYVAYWENVFESNVKELDISEHAEFIYVAGEYIYSPNYSCLSDEYKNSVLISVNDIPIDEYVTLKPYPSVIRYDSYHEKWYHKRADFNTVKGQEAKLKIRKADGTEETVDMFYDTVSSAEFLINYAAEMRSGSDKKDSSSSIEINDGIGYIEFKEFTNEAVLAFKERVSTLPQESPLIIDMRNNSGGLIRSLTDAFYPVLYNTSAEHTTTTFMTINGKTAEPVMFWIWVNEDNVSLVHGSKINAPTRKLYYKTTNTDEWR